MPLGAASATVDSFPAHNGKGLYLNLVNLLAEDSAADPTLRIWTSLKQTGAERSLATTEDAQLASY